MSDGSPAQSVEIFAGVQCRYKYIKKPHVSFSKESTRKERIKQQQKKALHRGANASVHKKATTAQMIKAQYVLIDSDDCELARPVNTWGEAEFEGAAIVDTCMVVPAV